MLFKQKKFIRFYSKLTKINFLMQNNMTKVVCIGGGHCNCQVLKLLKKLVKESDKGIKLTLVTDSAVSYYSGMLPGTVSKLYSDEDLKVHLQPLAEWCNADYVQQKVVKI